MKALQGLPLGARKARLSCSRVLCPRGFRGFQVLGLTSLWVLLGAFCGLALVVPVYVLRGALRFFLIKLFLLNKKKIWKEIMKYYIQLKSRKIRE